MTQDGLKETDGVTCEVPDSYLFDTNVIDKVLADPDLCKLFVSAAAECAVKFYVTHLAIDEVEKISIDRDDRRQALLQVLAQLPADRIATSTLVLGISRFDEACFGSDRDAEDFRRLTGGNVRHAEDAMLALTARSIGATVVSEDDDLRRMTGKLAINSITTGQLQQVLSGRLLESGNTPIG
jgi:predicted nucleic acid-binding protein